MSQTAYVTVSRWNPRSLRKRPGGTTMATTGKCDGLRVDVRLGDDDRAACTVEVTQDYDQVSILVNGATVFNRKKGR